MFSGSSLSRFYIQNDGTSISFVRLRPLDHENFNFVVLKQSGYETGYKCKCRIHPHPLQTQMRISYACGNVLVCIQFLRVIALEPQLDSGPEFRLAAGLEYWPVSVPVVELVY